MSQNHPVYEHTFLITPQKEKSTEFSGLSLLSPPEKHLDTFNTPISMAMSRQSSSSFSAPAPAVQDSHNASARKVSRPALVTPPISPNRPLDEVHREEDGTADPVLFSSSQSSNGLGNRPLFDGTGQSANQPYVGLIRQHQESHAGRANAPTEEEYQLTLESLSAMTFTSCVGDVLRRDPAKYKQNELRFLDYYTTAKRIAKAKTAAEQTALATRTPQQRRLAPAPEGGIRKKVSVPRVPRNPPKRRAPPARQSDDNAHPARKQLLKKDKKEKPEKSDNDYNSLPDYSPPTDMLGNNFKALKADWKGTTLDLSRDPDRHLLHEAEVYLASGLRLSCATYLTSKRRIFDARIRCIKLGRPMNKTIAQQSCRIDVNKASKLWTSFERVGWDDKKWFLKYL